MHEFSELVQWSTEFSLNALNTAQQYTIEELETSSATPLVKTLQMIQLQKVITAIGIFSMFDAVLQEELDCKNGFEKATELLELKNKNLKERFEDLQMAINVLKHGKGRSYDNLILKADSFPFRIKLSSEEFFNEGNIDEIDTLIEVDDAFVMICAKTIYDVSAIFK